MMYDVCQSPVSLNREEALSAWNGMIDAFLSHCATTPTHLGALLEQAPDFAMAHAAKGLFSLMLGRAEMVRTAQEAAVSAHASLASGAAGRREILWVEALDHWLSGKPSYAVDAMERCLDLQPSDTISAKVGHAIRFILGDGIGMRRSLERILDAHDPDHPCRGYLLGCYAFALEETGDYGAAEAAGLEGLALTPRDAWGLHAVTHVYDMTARPDKGISLIERNTFSWDHCNNFRYHVWWHKALLHMDRGELDMALGLYDAQIRADKTDDYRDISNATSLLVRLELEGLDVGPRWQELADMSEKRTEDGCVVFADLHYMLALTGADRPDAKASMTARFARDARGTSDMQSRYADPGQAALAGLNAFAEGRYDQAFAELSSARPSLQLIGGSHAQRDVFERLTIDAGIRAGRLDHAEHIIRDRLARRAGHADRYTTTRLDAINAAQRIPAQ